MVEHLLPGRPPVALKLRRSTRARRLTLRISQLDGRVTLTLPAEVPETEALAFARAKEAWIRRHLASRQDPVDVDIGAMIPVEGRPCRIVAGSGRRVILSDGEIAVPPDAVARRLAGWLRTLARDRLTAAADHYAAQLGKPYCRLTLRDTRSRWGSCTAQGALMFSWRLILAPPEVLRYVAAHEVAHLAEMNHSPAFWATVQRVHGPYEDARRWLRQNGAELHGFRF